MPCLKAVVTFDILENNNNIADAIADGPTMLLAKPCANPYA
jgi:hypothetical protein